MAELCAAGFAPSVLVPFPYAIHDHQTRNTEVLTRSGAACLCQNCMAVQHMSKVLLRLLTMPGEREPLAAAALSAARPDAAARVVAVLEETA